MGIPRYSSSLFIRVLLGRLDVLGVFGSSAANCSTFLTSNSFFRSSRFMAVASPSDWSLIEYSSSSAATCGCGFGWGWGWLFHGSAVRGRLCGLRLIPRVIAGSRLRNRLGLVPRVIARHIARHCLEEPKKPESGTEADSTGRLLLRSRLSLVPLRLIPRIIVRRLLIWLVPRVGFGRSRRR